MTALLQHHQQPPPESHFSDLSPRHPVTMQQPVAAKNVTVYMNGDQYYPGRKFVVNRRHVSDFDGFLNMVTVGLKPAFGAVRNIYTPSYGHKVTELDGINNGMAIVAGGQERFKKLHYKEITPPAKRHGKPKNDYAAIRPVYHNTRMNVAARWKDFAKGPCHIHVYVNGDINEAAARMLLIPRILKDYGLVLQEVSEKLASRTGRAVRRLHNLHGELVTGTEQFENGGYYVACGNEKFKRLPYGERAQHMAMVYSVKKPQVQLPPIHRRARTLNSKPHDPSYSQKYAVRKQFEEERQQHSQPPPGASGPPRNRRLRPIKAAGPPPSTESDSVFHAKPVKVKRSGASGKLTAVSAATDDNDDDFFRAKPTQIRAEEVADDEDTKVDLPIDQVPADTVEDEDVDVAVKLEEPEKRESSPEPKETYAERLEEDDSDLTERSSITPTSASREEPQPQPSVRSVENTEVNGGAVQPPEHQPVENKETKKTKTKDEAAVLIQSTYKGYKVRKEFNQRERTAEKGKFDSGPEGLENIEPTQKDTEDATDLLPLSQPRSVTPEGPGPASHQSTDEPRHLEDTQEQPITMDESEPTSAETRPVESPLPDIEKPEDVATEHAAPPANGGEEVPAAEQAPDPVPNTVDETEPDDRRSPTEETKANEPAVEAVQEERQPTPPPSGPENVENDFTAPKNEGEPGLPERDAGDGTEEGEAQQRQPTREDHQLNDEPQLNGVVPVGDADGRNVKANQDSTARSGPVTEGDDAEQPQKGTLDAGQIPNGQPATMLEGGV